MSTWLLPFTTWMQTVWFLYLPTRPCSRPVDEYCLFRFFQRDHAPDRRWKLSVFLHPTRPSWKAAAAAAAAPRSLARSLPSFLSGGGKALGIRKGGFWNRDSGIQKEREIDAAGGFVFVFPQELLESSLITSNHSLLQTETKRRRRIKKQQKKKKKKKKENKKWLLLLLLLHR